MTNLEPYTRVEKFLARAGGQNVETPEPITREEIFLADVVEKIEGVDTPTQEQVDSAVETYFDDHGTTVLFNTSEEIPEILEG